MAEAETRPDAAPESAPPERAQLRRAESAFARGDYRQLRDELGALAQDSDPQVRARVEQLARAVSVDPVLLGVLLACLLVLLAVFFHYVSG